VYAGSLVTLRPFRREDAETYRGWVNDPEVGPLIDRGDPVGKAEHERWYDALVSSDRNAVFAIDDKEGSFVGLVWLFDIHPRHRRAEVRIVIGERKAWGGGRGTEALRLITEAAFGPLALEKLWADVLATNPRAVAAFEKAGFVREGVLREDRVSKGQRVDVIRLGLLRAERIQGVPAKAAR
jgi:RimJ/RimL family protein N-acetyltransferase